MPRSNRGTPLGILLPIERAETGFFKQGFDVITQAKSNLINLLLTKKGERVMQPTFGCDIHGLVFDQITPNTISEVKSTIDQAVQTWLPYILLDDIEVDRNEDTNEIYVKITFGLRNNAFVSDTIIITI
jgi:phage baseplate assembly protein W